MGYGIRLLGCGQNFKYLWRINFWDIKELKDSRNNFIDQNTKNIENLLIAVFNSYVKWTLIYSSLKQN